MISGIDLLATVSYSCKNDKENPTIWHLGMIPSYLLARISSDAQGNEIEVTFRLLQIGLKGWDNFKAPFSTVKEKIYGREIDVVPMSLLEQIPLQELTELSVKLLEINNLSSDERKNLSAQSGS